ncbi:hypothetical protein Tco_0665511 [Tanacetum coccineum]
MASTRASISKASKRPKINIIPPKQLFMDLTQDDTKTPSTKLQLSSPSAPNAPSKTPSTKDISSSSIDYVPKPPTSSTSLSPNGYLNPPISPLPRVSPPPLTQENASMDITLTLSPINPLDVQFNTPSPSPPIVGHPIPWNLLEAHGDSCLCCIHNPQESGAVLDEEQSLFLAGEQVTNDDDDVDDSPENDLALNVDHVFEADECDAFDSDVDEGLQQYTHCIHDSEDTLELAEITRNRMLLKMQSPLSLFKEVKEMEEIFNQMNNEVDKNTVDKQCAEIEKKNLLIENENLIVNCLSTQLLYDVEKSRCLDLEADMSKVHDESKHISKLERECLTLQLKYQHLQESFDNNKSHIVQEAPDFNSFFKIKNLEHQIQEKDNVIRHLKDLVANVK